MAIGRLNWKLSVPCPSATVPRCYEKAWASLEARTTGPEPPEAAQPTREREAPLRAGRTEVKQRFSDKKPAIQILGAVKEAILVSPEASRRLTFIPACATGTVFPVAQSNISFSHWGSGQEWIEPVSMSRKGENDVGVDRGGWRKHGVAAPPTRGTWPGLRGNRPTSSPWPSSGRMFLS